MPSSPPAVILGGQSGTALSVARSLGRQGVQVFFLGSPDAPERYSRYVRSVPLQTQRSIEEAWADFLLGPAAKDLRGAVLIACSDAGIEFLLKYRADVDGRYLRDLCDPVSQQGFLNKLSTYRLAAEAGVPTPRFWETPTLADVEAHRDEYAYPVIVKPLFSHKFARVFGRKFLRADDFDELVEACTEVLSHDLEIMLLEWIPGPDDRLCSYYTYMDEAGEPLFHFTKRIVRRFPENEGLACCHVTDWNPEVRDLGLQLLTRTGHRGLANVEFKRDERDGRLKIIECNARFTAANALVAAAGYDLGVFVYNRIVGRARASLTDVFYKEGLHLWDPGRDFLAYLELRRTRGMRFTSYARSVLHPTVFRYFSWSDPGPSLAALFDLPARLSGVVERRTPARGHGRSVEGTSPAESPSSVSRVASATHEDPEGCG
jgi:D-aspartate ligase